MSSPSNQFLAALNYGTHLRAERTSTVVDSTPGVHRLALLTTIATFPLIFMGGLVTSHHAGMSVPDWPNSYGYNMFLFPPNRWVGGILYEHTHRLMATIVGMLSIALVLWSWRAQILALARMLFPTLLRKWNPPVERRRYLALSVLGAVIFQGVLGGLRVKWVNLDLAIVHACVAQAFFCLTTLMAWVTSRAWSDAPDLSNDVSGRHLVTIGMVTVSLIYLQLIVGATMRHFDAGLAIPDLPLSYGKLLPPTSAVGLEAVNHIRAFEMNLDPVTLTQLWLHFGHRIGAVVVSAFVIVLSVKAILRDRLALAGHAITLLVLLAAQGTLGVLTVALRKPADIASSHVAVGALVLVTSFVLTCRAIRLYRPRVRGKAFVESERFSSPTVRLATT